jgi:hypothetical protein
MTVLGLGGCSSVVEHVFSMCKALDSIPIMKKKNACAMFSAQSPTILYYLLFITHKYP